MAYKEVVLPKQTLAKLNQALMDLQRVYAECEKAEKAGIPGLDAHKTNCVELHDRIAKLKAAYFSQEV